MKSRFITVLWIFALVAGGIGFLMASLQVVSLWFMRSNPEIQSLLQESLKTFGVSLSLEQIDQILLRNSLSTAVTSILSVWIALALRRRREWARLASMVLLVLITLGMIVSLFSIEVQLGLPLQQLAVVLTAVIVVAHGGLILKLHSPKVREEFKRSRLN